MAEATVPLVRSLSLNGCFLLPMVMGAAGKHNDIILRPPNKPPATSTVVFFPGDVHRPSDEMQKTEPKYAEFCFENVAQRLGSLWPEANVLIVHPARMYRSTFAVYENFVKSNDLGVPDFRATTNSCSHILGLLENTGAMWTNHTHLESTIFGNGPISLVGFSKGCVVMNKLFLDMHKGKVKGDNGAIRLAERIKEMHWLDSGHSGTRGAWLTDRETLRGMSQTISKYGVHVTPYQVRDPMRPWIGDEEEVFVSALRLFGSKIQEKKYFDNDPPSLTNHFRLLYEFDPSEP
eukprot:comp21184_c0_seq1/m.28746 comp21184_c0_seq1/g.28746  ORF comp21184_c0_seq1/g.28746 comp21184_c0_seq1/m.28746 type:complete len:291 (-) comp21184_c0_seq1:721-1593(-)